MVFGYHDLENGIVDVELSGADTAVGAAIPIGAVSAGSAHGGALGLSLPISSGGIGSNGAYYLFKAAAQYPYLTAGPTALRFWFRSDTTLNFSAVVREDNSGAPAAGIKRPRAATLDQIFDDRARFSHGQRTVGDDGRKTSGLK